MLQWSYTWHACNVVSLWLQVHCPASDRNCITWPQSFYHESWMHLYIVHAWPACDQTVTSCHVQKYIYYLLLCWYMVWNVSCTCANSSHKLNSIACIYIFYSLTKTTLWKSLFSTQQCPCMTQVFIPSAFYHQKITMVFSHVMLLYDCISTSPQILYPLTTHPADGCHNSAR